MKELWLRAWDQQACRGVKASKWQQASSSQPSPWDNRTFIKLVRVASTMTLPLEQLEIDLPREARIDQGPMEAILRKVRRTLTSMITA